MAALQTAENTGDVAPLVALHGEGVTLRNLSDQTWAGIDGAHSFWETYLGNFETIRSEFFHHAELGEVGQMEWNATGKLKNGHDIEYRGISVIEIGGGKVTAFRTYYDSAAFVNPL